MFAVAGQEAFSPESPKAGQQAALGDDSASVAALCDLVAVFLNHGLEAYPPRCGTLTEGFIDVVGVIDVRIQCKEDKAHKILSQNLVSPVAASRQLVRIV